jgi:hypothetical protein
MSPFCGKQLQTVDFVGDSVVVIADIIKKCMLFLLTMMLWQVADFDDLEEDKFLNAVVKVGLRNICPGYQLCLFL